MSVTRKLPIKEDTLCYNNNITANHHKNNNSFLSQSNEQTIHSDV